MRFFLDLLAFLSAPPRSNAALESLCHRRLNDLLGHAHAHSAHYRAALNRAGWQPHSRWTPADLAAMPVLNRTWVRDHLGELLSSGIDPARCLRRLTSGTSGIPIHYPVTPLEDLITLRLWQQVYASAGLRPGHRQARFAFSQSIPAHPRLCQRIGLFRRAYFPMDAPVDAKIDWLRRTRPDALFAWASVLDELSRFLEHAGATLDIPLIFSTSTALFPPVRRRTAERFQGRVLDAYGAVETGPLAWDCPQGGYHVRHDTCIVELLDEGDRPAQCGRVVCTPLWRRALPLIRIDLGDFAEWDETPCECGVPGRRLRALHGRVMDLVPIGPDGAWAAPFRLLAPMYWLPGVRQFQLVQETEVQFRLLVVADSLFTADCERQAAEHYRREFGDRLHVRLQRVAAVWPTPGPKPFVLVTLARREQMRRDGYVWPPSDTTTDQLRIP